MRVWQLSDLLTKIENDLDLSDLDFISQAELIDYLNEGIREAEANIHTIYEDYFLTSYAVPLVTSTASYALPSDIYAMKIRKILYDNGSDQYVVRKIRDLETLPLIQTQDFYRFLITNDVAVGPVVKLYPTSRETSSAVMTLWYLRNAKRLIALTDTLDIPEFANFVSQFAKVRCYEKEGHPNVNKAMKDLDVQRELMVSTLETMIPDGDNQVLMDLSSYWDQDSCI